MPSEYADDDHAHAKIKVANDYIEQLEYLPDSLNLRKPHARPHYGNSDQMACSRRGQDQQVHG